MKTIIKDKKEDDKFSFESTRQNWGCRGYLGTKKK